MRGRSPDNPDVIALLVRPDGCVAWAADDEPDPAAAEAALRQWCGEPVGARASA